VNHDISGLCVYVCSIFYYIFFNEFMLNMFNDKIMNTVH
jgi:hypothetical protein